MIYTKIIPGTLVVLGILIGVFIVNPDCYAGGAMTLMPAEDRDIPQGSQIPEARSQEIEKKVKKHKLKMKGMSPGQQQEELTMNELPKPKALEEGN
jgi:hypothetical protein